MAIIGGGLSGLSTAAKLHRLDSSIEMVLFESGHRVGGVIHSEQVGEFLIDHGADMFSTKPSAALDFCRELGLEDQLIEPKPTRRGARIVRNGRLLPIPEGFVLMRATQLWPMLVTPLLSLKGKLRFLLERWIAPAKSEQDESISSFVQRRMGQEETTGEWPAMKGCRPPWIEMTQTMTLGMSKHSLASQAAYCCLSSS